VNSKLEAHAMATVTTTGRAKKTNTTARAPDARRHSATGRYVLQQEWTKGNQIVCEFPNYLAIAGNFWGQMVYDLDCVPAGKRIDR
jgi:hypothetical protein